MVSSDHAAVGAEVEPGSAAVGATTAVAQEAQRGEAGSSGSPQVGHRVVGISLSSDDPLMVGISLDK